MKTRILTFCFCLSGLLLNSLVVAAGWSNVSTAQTNWLVPGSGSTLFAANSSSIYASSDSGKTWTAAANPGGSPFSALSFFNGRLWVGTTQQGAAYSSNQGNAWTKSPIGTLNPFSKTYTYSQINDIALPLGSTSSLVAATAQGAFISSDGGNNWSSTVQGLPVSGVSCPPFCSTLPVYTLVGAAGGILAGTDKGVFRSSDNGVNWSVMGIPTAKIIKLSAGSSDVYAIADGVGLYKYTPGSGAWSQLTGLSAVPTAVLAHPSKAGVVFAGTAQGQVFTSTDSGATWTAISDATLPSAKINALAVPPDQANTLVAATSSGIFSYASGALPKFSFTIPPITGAPLSAAIVSAEVTVTGLTKAEPISISGGKYSINGRVFTDQPGIIANGARLRVQLQSSATPNTGATATVTINSVSAAFVVTTHKIAIVTDLTKVFVAPPSGAIINSDGSVTVTSTTPVKLQTNLTSGTIIQTSNGTTVTDNTGTISFTAQTDGAKLNAVDLTSTTKGTQVISGTFSVQSTASNTIPVGTGSVTTSATCPTTMSMQNTGTQTSTFVQNCVVYFNSSGAIASANGFSTTGTAVYGGETAEVSNSGSLSRIRIGSLAGDQKLPGDPLTLANITADATVPKLDGNLQRLNNSATLLTVIQEALNSKFGVSASQISYDNASGVVTYTVNSKVYRFIPIDVPTVQIGGAVASANRFAAASPASSASGAYSLASQGIQITLASSLGYFTDLDKAVKVIDQNAKVRLRSSGALQITLAGADYIGVPGSNAISGGTIQSPGFQLDSKGYYAFLDSTGAVQSLYPAFADISVADQTVKAIDPNGSASDNGDGTTTMILSGSSYTLRPGYSLIPLPAAHANDQWWQDGPQLYLRFPDDTAQGFTL